ncbi:MAG TPA: transglutaminaseTgpA domain-containing protein, partial [Elusimicrobiales bacterium]|nr:transglutaminaseTgpA domain-containing protein [Elusimicrobiales bacterium]
MTRDRAMRLTAPGWGALAAAFITLSAAAVSGNNLLYLLFATILAAFVLSWAAGKANLRPVVAGLSAPGQIFRGSEFSLKVILENRGRLPVLGLRLACRGQRRPVESLAAGGKAELELRYLLPHRGRNRPEDLRLESEFPFALLLHSRPLAAPELTALPRTPEIRSAAELGAGVEVLVSSAARRARSGDLWGVREMRADDDIRAVNWKLSAKAGRLMAVEYAEAAGARVTVRLEAAAAGPAGEQRVEEAAGACRFFIDSGAEVRLVMPGGGVDYGRGLLHLDRLLWALALAGDGAAARPAVHPDPAPAGAPADEALRRRLVLLGCWTVYACLLLIEEFRGSPAVLAAALLAGGAFAPQRGKGAPPARFWDAVSLAVLLYSVLFHWRQAGIMVANTWLVAYLLVYFAFNPGDRSARWRAYIVFYIGFFLVSGQTVSPLYLPAYLAFLAFSTAWMAAEWGAGLRSGRGWHRVLAAVMAAEFALAAAAFAVIPRIEPLGRRGPIAASLGWDKLRARSQAVTGFTTTVSLGYFGEIRRSSARVMRVKPLKPPPGPPPPLYVRAMAFDSFDGRRWYKGGRDLRYRLGGRLYWRMEGGAPMRRSGGLLVFPGAPAAAPASAAEYTIYPINLGVIFSAYPVVSVERPDGGAFFDYTDSAYFPAPYLAGITYTVNGSSGAPAEGAMALVEDPGKLLRLHLGVPAAADPRIAALARDLTLNRSDALSKVRAVE